MEGATIPLSARTGDLSLSKSWANGIVPRDTNAGNDVFVFDRQTRTMRRINAYDATVPELNYGLAPSISANGAFVTFPFLGEQFGSGGRERRE